jgi:hypothetical protein
LTTLNCSHLHPKRTAKVLSSAQVKPTTAHPAEQAQAQNSPVYTPMENCKSGRRGNSKASLAVFLRAACNWMEIRSSRPSQAKHGSWRKASFWWMNEIHLRREYHKTQNFVLLFFCAFCKFWLFVLRI